MMMTFLSLLSQLAQIVNYSAFFINVFLPDSSNPNMKEPLLKSDAQR